MYSSSPNRPSLAGMSRVARQVPGLYFLGLEFQYAVASATIQGLDRDARYLLRELQRRTGAEHGDQPPLVSPVSYA